MNNLLNFKTLKRLFLTNALIGFVCLTTINNVKAQKLPNKQEVSLRASAGVKVDGKALEWDNRFQAYNHATDIFYTMANDDDNLYLVVQAEDSGVIQKITQGGITLSIDKPNSDNLKNNTSITYPVVAKPLLFSNLTRKRNGKIVSLGNADSIIRHNNSILEINCKWIKIIGIKGLDTLISVYNVDGIKAAGLFDKDNKYVCEMSVSLKYLGISADNPSKFSYDIRLNGAKSLLTMTLLPRPNGEPPSEAAERFFANYNDKQAQLAAPTDFSGEYTLAKTMRLLRLKCFILLAVPVVSHAQKLANKQEVSLRAPIGVKVDGKDLEWNNHFQAYNHSTDIFCTMCNDDDNLYLVVQAEDFGTIQKITQGGITLSIDKAGTDNHRNRISITYPVVAKSLLFSNLTKKRNGKIVSLGDADSIINYNNFILEKNCKWIRVIGIEGLDTLISVYNTDGVKAAGLFNHDNKYTCEISISLKNLGLSTDNPSKFSYHITLNGAKPIDPGKVISYGNSDPAATAAVDRLVASYNDLHAQLSAPTDFGGEYTLAKKP